METPCVDVCILDQVSGFCIGCGRSGAEISRWVEMTPKERREIMAILPDRLDRLEAASKPSGSAP